MFRLIGDSVRRHGFALALGACLFMVGSAAYFARMGPPTPATGAAPVVMVPETVEQLKDVAEPPQLIWPVSGREILVPYSDKEPIYNKTLDLFTLHGGIDIVADMGEAVASACDGTVTAARRDPMLGYLIEITGEKGLVCRYANLTALSAVSAGQRVQEGDIIGSVGHSADGESLMKPHLHYAAFRDGVWALE